MLGSASNRIPRRMIPAPGRIVRRAGISVSSNTAATFYPAPKPLFSNARMKHGAGRRELRLVDLLHQVVLHPHLFDLVELGFDPVDVVFLFFQDGFDEHFGVVISHLARQANGLIVPPDGY
jgi:hypothetical protein